MRTKYDYIIKAAVPMLLVALLSVGIGIYSDVQQLKAENKENSEKIERLYDYLLQNHNKLSIK